MKRTVLVRMEVLGEPIKTPAGDVLHIVRFPWMEDHPIAIGEDDIARDASLCNCGFIRGRNRLTNDED